MISLKPKIEIDAEGRKIYTLSMSSATRFAYMLVIPVAILYGLPFFLLHSDSILLSLKTTSILIFFVSILTGLILHEMLHALVWAIFARGGFRAIRFGMMWEHFSPYCHCTQSLKVWQYVTGSLMPLIVMGFVPAVWALSNGSLMLLLLSFFFTVGAAGDILSVLMLRNFRSGQTVYDHPEELGFLIEENGLPEE